MKIRSSVLIIIMILFLSQNFSFSFQLREHQEVSFEQIRDTLVPNMIPFIDPIYIAVLSSHQIDQIPLGKLQRFTKKQVQMLRFEVIENSNLRRFSRIQLGWISESLNDMEINELASSDTRRAVFLLRPEEIRKILPRTIAENFTSDVINRMKMGQLRAMVLDQYEAIKEKERLKIDPEMLKILEESVLDVEQ